MSVSEPADIVSRQLLGETRAPSGPRVLRGHGLELRPWNEDLVQQMACWQERGFPFHAFDLASLRDEERAAKHLDAIRKDHGHRYFVAVEDGIAVGRLAVNLQDNAGLYIWQVHVPPDHEGRGVCKRMMRVVLEWLGETYPETPIVLTTNTLAKAAHRVYRGLGFEIVDTRWQYDPSISRSLWHGGRDTQLQIAAHVRFARGHWEVKSYTMEYVPHIRPGANP